MTTQSTEQTQLRSSHHVTDLTGSDADSPRDDDDVFLDDNLDAQRDDRAIAASHTQAILNPWAPAGWARDLPPKVEPYAKTQQQGSAQPTTQQLLQKTLAAITSLQQCVATLATTVITKPPQVAKANPPPQLRHTGVRPTPTLADIITSPTNSQKRYGH